MKPFEGGDVSKSDWWKSRALKPDPREEEEEEEKQTTSTKESSARGGVRIMQHK